jgi:16S rRNA (cytosine967-C5)-methyltransferase
LDKRKSPQGARGRRPDAAPAPVPPPGLAARQAAAAALADVVAHGRTLDERFATPAYLQLEPRDRALARSIVVASLRRLGTLRAALARFLERGLPKKSGSLEHILVVGAAQILLMEAPDHAAVDLAVRAARADQRAAPYAGLVNAVLRNVAREKDALLRVEDPFLDLPQWLSARWRKAWGDERAARMAAMLRCEPTLDVSVRGDAQEWARRLDGIVLPTGSVRLLNRAPVQELPGYAEGEWWVQDAAAAIPARLLRAGPGMRVADLCAAPGGKTAQLAAAGAQVVALDRSAERLRRLAANMERLRLSVDVAVGDALAYEAAPFDAILLDAPCTATGTIRRHPDVAWVKRASDVAALAVVQGKMLDRACSLLKPGGTLVYCTCSLEPEEGPAQIAALLRRNPDMARAPVEAAEIGGLSDCLTPEGDVRTTPDALPNEDPRLAGLDGFFVARVTRRA